MPATPKYALPYPTLDDPPNGPAQLQSLAQATENAIPTLNAVLTYASASARDAVASPADGTIAYTQDDDMLWARVNGAWRPMVPGGIIATATGPGATTDCGATLTTLASITVPVLSGRRYRITGTAIGTQLTAAGAQARFIVTVVTGHNNIAYRTTLPLNEAVGGTGVFFYTATSTTSVTFALQGSTNTGALRVSAGNTQITAEYVD